MVIALPEPPASKEAFFAQLHRYTLDFSRMKPLVELTVRDHALDVEGYVVVWNVLEEGGLAKGGTRVTPTVTLDEVKMLARTMALKNAAAGLPLGGAKSGIRGQPGSSGFKQRFQSIARRFQCLFPEHGGPFGGLGYDLGARPEYAAWFVEATGLPRRFTGKPVELGGTDYDKEGIAGLGVAEAARAALAFGGQRAHGVRYAVQGLGAMGAGVVRAFGAEGAVLVAVSDPLVGGTWTLCDTLPAAQRRELLSRIVAVDRAGTRELLDASEHATNDPAPDAVLYADADVLFPCAVHDVVHHGNQERIRARLVVEGANGPVKAAVRELLFERGTTVVPDFLANAGGIIAAHVEMADGLEDKVTEAKARTRSIIAGNVTRALELAAGLGVTPYEAASWIALARIFAGRG